MNTQTIPQKLFELGSDLQPELGTTLIGIATQVPEVLHQNKRTIEFRILETVI